MEFDSWSGRCSDGLGTGTGEYIVVSRLNGEYLGTAELPYMSGVLYGTEVTRYKSGRVIETVWVNDGIESQGCVAGCD